MKGNVGISLMVAQPGERPGATLGSWGLSLMRQSQHKEAAVEAIRYLTSEDAQRQRFLNNGYTPCLLYTSPSPRDMRRSRMPSSA